MVTQRRPLSAPAPQRIAEPREYQDDELPNLWLMLLFCLGGVICLALSSIVWGPYVLYHRIKSRFRP